MLRPKRQHHKKKVEKKVRLEIRKYVVRCGVSITRFVTVINGGNCGSLSLSVFQRLVPKTFLSLLSTAVTATATATATGRARAEQRSAAQSYCRSFFFLLAYNLCHQHFVVVIVSEGKRERAREGRRERETEIELQ